MSKPAEVSERRLAGIRAGRLDRRKWRVPRFNVTNISFSRVPFWQDYLEGYVEGYFR